MVVTGSLDADRFTDDLSECVIEFDYAQFRVFNYCVVNICGDVNINAFHRPFVDRFPAPGADGVAGLAEQLRDEQLGPVDGLGGRLEVEPGGVEPDDLRADLGAQLAGERLLPLPHAPVVGFEPPAARHRLLCRRAVSATMIRWTCAGDIEHSTAIDR